MAQNSSVQADPIGSALASGPDLSGDPDELSSEVIAQDLLVEEVSIDGMCGVY